MPAIFLAIAGFLGTALPPIIVRVLAALGIGAVVYKGVEVGASALRDHVVSAYGGIPADISAIFSIAGFGVFFSLVISACVAGVSVKVAMGAFKKIGFKE